MTEAEAIIEHGWWVRKAVGAVYAQCVVCDWRSESFTYDDAAKEIGPDDSAMLYANQRAIVAGQRHAFTDAAMKALQEKVRTAELALAEAQLDRDLIIRRVVSEGWTQKEVARAMGLTQQRVQQIAAYMEPR